MKRRKVSWLALTTLSRNCNLNDVPNMIERYKNRGVRVDTSNESKIFHNIHEAFDYLEGLLKELSE